MQFFREIKWQGRRHKQAGVGSQQWGRFSTTTGRFGPDELGRLLSIRKAASCILPHFNRSPGTSSLTPSKSNLLYVVETLKGVVDSQRPPPPPPHSIICTVQQVLSPNSSIFSTPPSTLPYFSMADRENIIPVLKMLLVVVFGTFKIASNHFGACNHVTFICGSDLVLDYNFTHICGLHEIEVEVLAYEGDRYSARNVLQGFPFAPLVMVP